MKQDLLPIIIVIAVLGLLYLILRSINRKKSNRLKNNRFGRRIR